MNKWRTCNIITNFWRPSCKFLNYTYHRKYCMFIHQIRIHHLENCQHKYKYAASSLPVPFIQLSFVRMQLYGSPCYSRFVLVGARFASATHSHALTYTQTHKAKSQSKHVFVAHRTVTAIELVHPQAQVCNKHNEEENQWSAAKTGCSYDCRHEIIQLTLSVATIVSLLSELWQ